MRILWHSVAPWLPTGYGTQTALWTRYLSEMGHDVAISTYFGNPGYDTEWSGMPVFAGPIEGGGLSLLPRHIAEHKPDVVVLLCDMWTVNPSALNVGVPVLCWTPVDTTPLGMGEEALFRHGPPNVRPVAMSIHGYQQFMEAGIEPAGYVPHALDTEIWRPRADREQLREALGVTGKFAVGMNFNNVDPQRKATPQQLGGFHGFHRKHPDSVLFLHTMARMQGSIDVVTVVSRLGLADTGAVRLSDQERMRAGDFSTRDMIAWYSAMDVVLNATCGEGFGLAAIEAQACGTPVILADNSSGRQLMGPGSVVACAPIWNPTHNAWWGSPKPDRISGALDKAVRMNGLKQRAAARSFAERYDIRTIGPTWSALLANAVDR